MSTRHASCAVCSAGWITLYCLACSMLQDIMDSSHEDPTLLDSVCIPMFFPSKDQNWWKRKQYYISFVSLSSLLSLVIPQSTEWQIPNPVLSLPFTVRWRIQ
jgi:hypothetical protein